MALPSEVVAELVWELEHVKGRLLCLSEALRGEGWDILADVPTRWAAEIDHVVKAHTGQQAPA